MSHEGELLNNKTYARDMKTAQIQMPATVLRQATFLTSALSAGKGMVTAADGSIVTFNITGLQCQENTATGTDNTPGTFNGTYRITGGTDRFRDAAGGGSLTASLTNPFKGHGVSFIKIDGAINLKSEE